MSPRARRGGRVAAALPLVAGAAIAIAFIGLLLVLLVRSSGGSAGWSVVDSRHVLIMTFILLEGIAVATGTAAVLALGGWGGRGTWIVLGTAGVALAVAAVVWFADLGRALVLAVPCAYLAVYAGIRVWSAAGGSPR